ncbi:2TM domain-containing protein [Tenacibaculum tangerinum]|uniref:2TM domain-containing protein n=1 Tax=Tenacibaculum tangerinum TaxID=3038772 RepID=A0ABY8L302_9FLAO|nr:2TM domain-containing protein [Tenacibaculum tangerinum]WGH75821.1 2TM domain-containing protein [Tenacibaculum tangerinum]
MEGDNLHEQKYLLAKKRVDKIKGFYHHLLVYVVVNVFISAIIITGLMRDDKDTFTEAISNFGVYSTWLFWGIGIVFHWLGVFGTKSLFSKDWEERKIQEYINEFEDRRNGKF